MVDLAGNNKRNNKMKAITCTQALIAIAVMQIVSAAFAGEIRTSTVNNIDWTYEVTSEENKTASLVYQRGSSSPTTISSSINEDIYIPASIDGYSITQISNQAFRACLISGVTIPDTIEIIGKMAFQNCTNLQYISLSEGVKEIGSSAFTGTRIENLTIPSSVTNISDRAFANCQRLSTLTILGESTEIDSKAFDNCSLSDIYIPTTENDSSMAVAFAATIQNSAIKSLTQFDAAGESFMTRLTPPSAPGGKWQITAFASVADGDASGLSPGNVRVLYGTSAATATADAHARLAYVTNAVMVRLEFDHPDDAAVQYYKVKFGN